MLKIKTKQFLESTRTEDWINLQTEELSDVINIRIEQLLNGKFMGIVVYKI